MSSSGNRRSSLQDHHHRHYRHHHSPSFSSTLLDEIYRSFDDHQERENRHTTTHHINSRMNIKTSATNYDFDTENRFDVDRWMNNEKIKVRRASLPEGILRRSDHRRPINHNYSSTSTSSSDSFGFSSSDTESLYRSSKQTKPPPSLKPIRTAEIRREIYSDEIPPAKKKKEGNLHRRALKLYGDLKKVKQPISPGGKLANFLNSLFNSNGLKKPKMSSSSSPSSYNGVNLERETVSAPSTASTRSCLSKTPSSAGGRFEKRSVRFVDEERRHVITRNGAGADVAKLDSSILASDEEFKHQMRERHRRVEEMAKELLKNYHDQNSKSTVDFLSAHHHHHDLRKFRCQGDHEERESEDEDEDEDDDASCCSSDLFELEIGGDHRYREELPVYETTRFDPNRAIAI